MSKVFHLFYNMADDKAIPVETSRLLGSSCLIAALTK